MKPNIADGFDRYRFLLSYHYYKKLDMKAFIAKFSKPVDIFIDSGAFSAESLGVPIKIDDYIAYLHKWEAVSAVYANLDVIRDWQATRRNQSIIEAAGLKPLPVFHKGAPKRELERLCERYDYIALGGCVGTPVSRLAPWLAACFTVGRKYKTRFHGFGITSSRLVEGFDWKSVDSSSCSQGPRYGRYRLFCPRFKRWATVNLYNPAEAYKELRLLRDYGMTPNQFALKSKYFHCKSRAAAEAAWLLYAEHIRKHIYLAETTGKWLTLIGEHYGNHSNT